VEPIIRNYRNFFTPPGPAARLVSLDDNPPTTTLSYSHILPGETSSHHIHPWEHEVFMIKGSGTLFCDGVEYPVKAGDAIFIPGNVDHYTLNNGGEGEIQRIEINPLLASQSGGANNNGGEGTGEPPVIKNLADLDTSTGAARPVLTAADGAANYTLAHRGMAAGEVSPDHTHAWEHLAYFLEGSCILTCDGQEYTVSEGDAILIPPFTAHEWSRSDGPVANWLVFNPVGME
jgi:quercetin dioxygenase-like cupin family protein